MKPYFIAGAIACAMATSAAGATLNATAVNTDQSVGDFSVVFTDTNGNGLLDFNEITDVPSVPVPGGGAFANPTTVTGLVAIPDITNISVAGGVLGPVQLTSWTFNTGLGQIFSPTSDWTYSITGLTKTPEVPLPASVMLLLAGLGGLGVIRKRAK